MQLKNPACIFITYCLLVFSCRLPQENILNSISEKIDGVNFVSLRDSFKQSHFENLAEIRADWVAFNPYAYSAAPYEHIVFNTANQWFGETTMGVEMGIRNAQMDSLKVMLKPHLWIIPNHYTGDFVSENWAAWEESYRNYIMTYAKIAERLKVELLCIGTELREFIAARPDFWLSLIHEIRSVYSGKLTYAANWDDYKDVPFWDELDYIGVDAYFPLQQPDEEISVSMLNKAWNKILADLRSTSENHKRPILFTEFGYRSIDNPVLRPWESDDQKPPNISHQAIAYQSFFETVWIQDFFAGGFLWKWYPYLSSNYGFENDYTPQGKPETIQIIRSYYR